MIPRRSVHSSWSLKTLGIGSGPDPYLGGSRPLLRRVHERLGIYIYIYDAYIDPSSYPNLSLKKGHTWMVWDGPYQRISSVSSTLSSVVQNGVGEKCMVLVLWIE